MITVQSGPEAIKPLLRDLGQGPTQGRPLTRAALESGRAFQVLERWRARG